MTILFVLLFVLLVLVFARQAYHEGVLIQYWGIIGLSTGLGIGYLFFQFAIRVNERLDADTPMPMGLILIVSGVVGLIVYFIARGVTKAVLIHYFGPDSSLDEWTDGMRGASLSLVPSVITVVILASGLRLGGTLMELRHLEYICRPRVSFSASKYPSWPIWVKWRDSIEGIPLLASGLYLMDPISRVPERRIVCLLVACKKPGLLKFFQTEPETAPIFDSIAMREMMVSDDITDMLKNFQHVGLIKHPLVHQAAHDPVASEALADLELQRLIDAFMLSPKQQQRIKDETIENKVITMTGPLKISL